MIATVLSTLVATTTVARDPLEYGPWIAAIEGGWSLVLTAGWVVGAQSWDPPILRGVSSLVVARVMYGTSWSALLALEVAVARLLAGEDWAGLSQANFRSEWWIGFDVPGPCTASCAGVGGFNEVRVALNRSLEIAASSGWIQGRASHDRAHTLLEATWVQSPIGLRIRRNLGPIEWALGPAIYWGLHNHHLHARKDAPWHGITVLDSGAGPGAHADVQINFSRYFAVAADLDLGLFVLSNEGEGPLIFRRFSTGIAVTPENWPEIGLRWMGLELSRRSFLDVGHKAVMLRFDFPIYLQDED